MKKILTKIGLLVVPFLIAFTIVLFLLNNEKINYIGFDGRLVTDKAQALKEEFYVKPSLNSDEETIILTIPL